MKARNLVLTLGVFIAAACGLADDQPSPEEMQKLYLNAIELDQSGRHEEAVERFNEVIRNAPGQAPPLNGRAIALHNLGRDEEALQDLDAALAIDGEYAMAYNTRAGIYLDTGLPERAVGDLDSVLELQPRHEAALKNLAQARLFLAGAEMQKATEAYGRLAEISDTPWVVYTERAAVWISMGLYDRAFEDTDRAIELNPDYALAWALRGNARTYTVGQGELACADWRRACELGYEFSCDSVKGYCRQS
jgi:tetratricopeptide (TPR) repeat protein